MAAAARSIWLRSDFISSSAVLALRFWIKALRRCIRPVGPAISCSVECSSSETCWVLMQHRALPDSWLGLDMGVPRCADCGDHVGQSTSRKRFLEKAGDVLASEPVCYFSLGIAASYQNG